VSFCGADVYYNFFDSCPDIVQGMSRTCPGFLLLFTGETGKNREKCGTNLPLALDKVSRLMGKMGGKYVRCDGRFMLYKILYN